MEKSLSSTLLVPCDDAATVEAALNLIDHCDDPLAKPLDQAPDFSNSLDCLSEFIDHVDIPAFPSETNAVNKPTVNTQSEQDKRRRTTPKQEIAQLRAEERELAVTLENLRLQNYGQKYKSTKNSKVLPFWMRIASRQYQTRLNSERENRRLRSLVTVHISRAKRLKLELKKQMATVGYNKDTSTSIQNFDELFALDTPTVLQQLMRDADAVYASLTSFLSGVQQQDPSQVPFLDHTDLYSMPFEWQVVDRAIWRALVSRFSGHQQQTKVTEDTIRGCALRALQMSNMNLRLRIRWVAKMYRKAGRTVIITRTFMEPLLAAIPANVGFKETQVTITTPLQCPNGNRDASCIPATLVDTHMNVTGNGPDGGSGDGMRSWIVSPGGVAARNVWMQAFEVRKNAIEDQLFEESRNMSGLSHGQ